MSAYPPPPPVPPQGQYPPFYDRRAARQAAKQQRQLYKQQARMQRDQARAVYRASRRGSIAGPLLLVALGVVFLLVELGKLSWSHSLEWFGRWWPALLIGVGLLLVIEWAIDQSVHGSGTYNPPRRLGAGIVVLLIFLAIVGGAVRVDEHFGNWNNNLNFGDGFHGWDFALGNQHDWDDSVSSPIAEGAPLTIRDPHGDITVAGSSDDGQVHVNVHKRAHAVSDSEAADRERQLQPTFYTEGGGLVLSVASVAGDGHADLTVQVPRGTALTVAADDGAVSVQGIHAAVTLTTSHGEVNLSGIDGPVIAHLNDGDESFSAHSITGKITLDGHVGDVTISDVSGAVDLHGAFFGTTNIERVNGAVDFNTHRTQFTAARVDGSVEVAEGSELQASQVLGPMVLHTSDRNITLERVEGSVDIANTDGSVALTLASRPGAPMGNVNITNHDGSVAVGLPRDAGFHVAAHTRDGNIENDFGLQAQSADDSHTLNGSVGAGGATVSIETREGDVTLNKSDAAPLGPAPAEPVRITSAPLAPATPATPASKASRAPKAKPAPEAPAAPKSPQAPPPSTTF